VGRGSRQSAATQHRLPEFALGFQPVTQCAAANHLKTIAAQRVLRSAPERRFKHGNALVAGFVQPAEFGLPVRRELQHAAIHVPRRQLLDKHPHLMALRRQAVVHRAQVVGFPNAQEPHGPGRSA